VPRAAYLVLQGAFGPFEVAAYGGRIALQLVDAHAEPKVRAETERDNDGKCGECDLTV
jgi:hypothetical protein